MDKKRFGAIVLLAGVLVLVTAGIASAQTLQNGIGTTIECAGSVTWHFVHNQIGDATGGTFTGMFSGTPYSDSATGSPVLHYYVVTPGGLTLMSGADNVTGGVLVLSGTPTCQTTTTTTDPSTTTTTTSTTTTSTTTTSTTTTSTTTTSTTTTTIPGQTTTTTTSTTTTVPDSTTLGTSTTTTEATTTSEETAGPGTLPYTGSPIDGGSFPNFDLVLAIVGGVLVLGGAGILVKSYWTH